MALFQSLVLFIITLSSSWLNKPARCLASSRNVDCVRIDNSLFGIYCERKYPNPMNIFY